MQPAPELCDLIQQYYDASARGDTAFLARFVAHNTGSLVIGTDHDEWWQDGDAIIAVWSAAWRERGGLPVHASQPQAFRSGAIGWLADRATWRLPDGRSIPFRLTAVLHHDGETWRMVQAHFSIGVPNERLTAEL